jgi:GT2 family glycosyltransferase
MSATFVAPTSRNAPCPCGSGRRYKECHGALASVTLLRDDALATLLAAALTAQEQGRFGEARAMYERALSRDPKNFDALHMLGVVHLQQHEFARARELIAAACALRPDISAARNNLRLADRAIRAMTSTELYPAWIAGQEARIDATRAGARVAVAARSDAPRLAIAMPTYNAPPRWLAACIDSVLAQTYSNWELCIADDASSSGESQAVLALYASRDERIRVVSRTENGHISAASNSALALATAPYVALLDHDDVLPPHALAEVALALVEDPAVEILYSDEDKIDEAGTRFEPYFKPDWNPALARSQNFVSHLGVYRTALLRAVGGFREGVEGAQDWDVLLRCADRILARQIRHIPQVLYHWRAISGSTARTMDNKRYAAAAQERVLRDDAARRGGAVALSRVVYDAFLQADPIVAELPSISLIVLRTNAPSDAAATARWQATVDGIDEILVAQIEAEPDPARGIETSPLRLGRDGTRAVNEVAARARGDVLVFVADDLVPRDPKWAARLAAHALQSDVGGVGGMTLDAAGLVARSGYILDPARIAASPFIGEAQDYVAMGGRNLVVQNLSALRLDAMAICHATWQRVGGLDTTHLTARFHDIDLCLRLTEHGYRHVWHPGVVFDHDRHLRIEFPGETAAQTEDGDAAYMRERWASSLACDPAYNPNLDRPPRLFELPIIAGDRRCC